MTYAIYNPIPWLLFLLGVIICVASVKVFHRKFPQYPFGLETSEVLANQVMDPVSSINVGAHPRLRVGEHVSIAIVQELLARGATHIGVENGEGKLIGMIGSGSLGSISDEFQSVCDTPAVEILGR